KRLAQTQVCPALRNLEAIAPATAASRSASEKTIKGALPPSSMVTFLTPLAACCDNSFPTAVEPVKVILRTCGCVVNSLPMAAASVLATMFITPGGTPAHYASTTKARADNGVAPAGLATTVHPAAKAGAILRASMALGKFHGVIAATTPTGCLSVSRRLSADGGAITSP